MPSATVRMPWRSLASVASQFDAQCLDPLKIRTGLEGGQDAAPGATEHRPHRRVLAERTVAQLDRLLDLPDTGIGLDERQPFRGIVGLFPGLESLGADGGALRPIPALPGQIGLFEEVAPIVRRFRAEEVDELRLGGQSLRVDP